jgi:DNA-3-methyladenine glycosylase II
MNHLPKAAAPDGTALRALDPDEAVRAVQQVKGLGPLAAELVVIRGTNTSDALPRHELRLEAAVNRR